MNNELPKGKIEFDDPAFRPAKKSIPVASKSHCRDRVRVGDVNREKLIAKAKVVICNGGPTKHPELVTTMAELMADFALSLLQWKDVADGLPEVEGQYSVVKGSGKTPFYLTFPKAEDKSAYAQIVRMMWAEEIAAYIPVPIPEWKEQR